MKIDRLSVLTEGRPTTEYLSLCLLLVVNVSVTFGSSLKEGGVSTNLEMLYIYSQQTGNQQYIFT